MNYTFQFGEVTRYWTWLLNGLLVTLAFTFVAAFLSVAVGILGAVARRSRFAWVRAVARLYVEIMRNTPFLVQLFILFFGLPSLGIRLNAYVAALIGLVLYNGAFMTEIIRAGLGAVHRSQVEAGLSIGMSRLQVFRHVVLVPALQKVYPALSSQFILLMLSTSVISAIGVDELTSFAGHIQTLNFRSIEVYLVSIVIYFIMTLLLRAGARSLGYVLFPYRRGAAAGAGV
ncbi:amino acid ABC transporter permease [Bosea sp. (in: a-proteobacteria)]|uniref:amino acid ABC transporter permease n=1 Tax=Bosea sp. (in: a-proteobacteria) TaxID=1871050 RepID=UPI002602C228|nr:amino acid ABC transporter permease [Bosea sp. (in: a-proteobacteria)]MCO5092922.1 amino acid ABC transporter permease [Bosea sp. (in: a-proteobacteria)]